MKCPKCGADEDKVIDSRTVRDGAEIRRRRECLSCGCRFTTYEKFDRDEVTVVKRDGTREPFSRMKLENGLRVACRKRPVTDDQIGEMIDSVMSLIDGDEITTDRIGELILDRLRKVDEVAWIRFASVYRRFSSIEQFLSAIGENTGSEKKQ